MCLAAGSLHTLHFSVEEISGFVAAATLPLGAGRGVGASPEDTSMFIP